MTNVNRINDQQIASYNRTQQARENASTGKVSRDQNANPKQGPEASQPDNVSVSEQGRDLQRVTEYVRNLPDTRQDRVNELRQQIRAGSYEVPAEKLAERLLGGE